MAEIYYVRHRVMRWDLVHEAEVRGLPSTDWAAVFDAVLADPDFQPGDTIELRAGTYPIHTQVNLTKPCTVRGTSSGPTAGATCLYDGGFAGTMFNGVGTPDLTFEDFGIAGPVGASNSFAGTQFAIKAGGPTWAARTSGLTVRRMRFTEMANAAVRAEFLTEGRCHDNELSKIAREGFMSLSTDGFWVDDNVIDTMTQPAGQSVSYPIAFSRQSTEDLTLRPRSSNWKARGNIIRNQPKWEGIDTHAGIKGVIADNVLIDCYQPIAVVSGAGVGGGAAYGPQNVSVERNVCLSTRDDGTYRTGITLQGAGTGAGAAVELAKGLRCRGNVIVGHGQQGTSNSGGIISLYTRGAVIEGNELYECSPGGIVIQNDNYGYQVVNNRAEDCWSSEDVFRPTCYNVVSTFSNGIIAGNSTSRGSKVAQRVNERGIGIVAGSPVTVLGPNDLDGVVQRIFDASTASEQRFEARRLGFYGAVPVVRPIVADGASPAEIVAALKQLGLFGS